MLLYLVKTVITLISLSSVSESSENSMAFFWDSLCVYVLFEGLFMIGHIRDDFQSEPYKVNSNSVPFIVLKRKLLRVS